MYGYDRQINVIYAQAVTLYLASYSMILAGEELGGRMWEG
jgi:hypothetical protein